MSSCCNCPPPDVFAYALAYRCADCTGRVARLYYADGCWHADIEHDDGCPVLAGTTPRATASLAAAAAVAANEPMLYIEED